MNLSELLKTVTLQLLKLILKLSAFALYVAAKAIVFIIQIFTRWIEEKLM